jgi:hypothetical protein
MSHLHKEVTPSAKDWIYYLIFVASCMCATGVGAWNIAHIYFEFEIMNLEANFGKTVLKEQIRTDAYQMAAEHFYEDLMALQAKQNNKAPPWITNDSERVYIDCHGNQTEYPNNWIYEFEVVYYQFASPSLELIPPSLPL